jgi:ABC-type transport system involved in multi-copper enzyme maturation permease subunit
MRAFRSEWIKLSRRNTWLGFGGAMVGFAALITALVFANAGGVDLGQEGPGGPGGFASAATLSLTDGSVFAITQAATFLGIIALALFASNLAGEFNKGTIRMLFVAEPNRLKVLAGKLAALVTFVSAWMAVALVVSVGVGAALASGAGVDTGAWWTAAGLASVGTTYLNLAGAMVVAGLIGTVLAVLTRSAAISISVGAAYLMIVEPLVSTLWTSLGDWGPSAALNSLAAGGTAAVAYATAAILVAGYAAASLAISSVTLARRDVTS